MIRMCLYMLILLPLPSFAEVDWSEVTPKLEKSVPVIFSGGGLCSGSLVAPDKVLTAWHCVNRMLPIEVAWQDDIENGTSATIIRAHKKLDLALLKLSRPTDRPLVVLAEPGKLKIGEPVSTMGHPMAMKPFAKGSVNEELVGLFSTGVVSKINKKQKEFVTDMSLSPGNSGGPVVNRRGEQVGVVSRKHMGFGVGQIGLTPGPDGIATLMAKEPEKEVIQPRLRDGRSRAGLYLTGSQHSRMDDVPGLDSWLTGYYFHIDFFDRLRLYFENSFDDEPEYDLLGAGWAVHIPFSRSIIMTVVPAWEQWTYNFAGQKRDFSGWSMTVEFTGLPLQFRWSFIEGENRREDIFIVGISPGILGAF
ncbi:MAG: trypsin-like peptidase domain-containing protein [Bdellovibrionaceae bacterium]|nr:trypsin-like peptidase domain-containing protein [Bdellovibrionales bacterium]MCB9086404.1 trypsin-like peptidase domain-containing protein [Pseudobdellovibrionaceae bacterium]